jgi:hypothetical protein
MNVAPLHNLLKTWYDFEDTILQPLLWLALSCHIPVDRKAILRGVRSGDPCNQRKKGIWKIRSRTKQFGIYERIYDGFFDTGNNVL